MTERRYRDQLTEAAWQKIKKIESGRRFGRLVVVEFSYLRERAHWSCRCDCGEMVVVNGHALQRGNTRSCGCLRKERGHGA